MKRKFIRPIHSLQRQRGVGVLLVAIVLLGIVTVMTLFSLSAGLFEQRTVTNETRYRLAYQTAQAGMDQGLEFIKSNTANAASCWLWPGISSCTAGESKRWTYCTATDMTAPCGAVEPGVANSTIRANYMYYNDANGRGSDDPKTLNFALSPVTGATNNQAVSTIGSFSVNYKVNALLCLLDTVTTTNQCLTPTEFTNTYGNGSVPSTTGSNSTGYGANPYSPNGLFAVTLVSRSQLAALNATDNEGAQAVLKATVATYRIIGTAPDVPLVASSSVTGLGNAEIVANPNAGGVGIPLSIWSAGCIHVTASDNCGGNSNASFATCHVDEFFKTGGANTGTCNAPSSGAPCQYDGSTTCGGGGSGCSCSKIAQLAGNNGSPYGLGALSGHYGTNSVAGPDLLGVGVNGPIPDTQFFPLHVQNSSGNYLNNPPNEFDNTPFEYAFSTTVADANSVMLDADGNGIDDATDFLQAHFTDITGSGGCGGLSSSSRGFLYTTKGVNCQLPNAQVGTPITPVVLVVQGDVTFSSNTTFFGFIFMRSSAAIGESVVTATTYDVKATGSGQLYGAMILEGGPKISGSPQLIYDKNTLNNVINGPDNTRMGFLPGSWSDAGRIDVSTGAYSEQ